MITHQQPEGTYPRVAKCLHCGVAVLRDNDGRFIHVTLAYVCRNQWGGVEATTAEPSSPIRP